MQRIGAVCFALFIFTIVVTSTALPIEAGEQLKQETITTDSSFSTALETLQKQINYTFCRIDLLRRAMTHASFSEENNRALSVLGTSIIETSISLQYLLKDIDISSKTLNRKIQEISNVESSCAVDGTHLGLHKVIRVSRKTDPSAPVVVCGAFRAIFGAIALDSGKSDDGGAVFWNVHSRSGGVATSL